MGFLWVHHGIKREDYEALRLVCYVETNLSRRALAPVFEVNHWASRMYFLTSRVSNLSLEKPGLAPCGCFKGEKAERN